LLVVVAALTPIAKALRVSYPVLLVLGGLVLALLSDVPNIVLTPELVFLTFLTFFVILATLVGQGLSLPLLIRPLRTPNKT
jgi:hypothetical protein